MKYYQPRHIKPSTNQFYESVKDRLSEAGQRSAAYQAVLHLFKTSKSLYRTLDFYTSETLAVFVDSNKYLTVAQEHDLVSLTSLYVSSIDCQEIHNIVDTDQTITEDDRTTLKTVLNLYKTIAETSSASLGQPRWIE
ncbi:hypothetical protein C7B65_00175 [Phormidesmis priestleyi ULC007]|uniref:Uncharacterized protein n=1 Tax=Phormidesmis priestleyi ULC007 TaxID=1920490 RepID=A0A2T1DN37_9CYAN|nr:hypothetical protein [Phormidesmis priestleyi]PSB21881.1 hypothetical protein C7B65_00175 [Phormidesmis priestleyi ULC007]PZO50537.1 MAG: hypothetical protein DCF14_11465 [Phormidesmis priestleyi]